MPILVAFINKLRREGKVGEASPVRRTAGWIPVWGPPETAVFSGGGASEGLNVLFAGDAGGSTDPVTGAGIWPAVATGRMAGECAARAALAGDPTMLASYDGNWRDLFGAALTRAQSARRRIESEWDSRPLPDLVRAAWPGL